MKTYVSWEQTMTIATLPLLWFLSALTLPFLKARVTYNYLCHFWLFECRRRYKILRRYRVSCSRLGRFRNPDAQMVILSARQNIVARYAIALSMALKTLTLRTL